MFQKLKEQQYMFRQWFKRVYKYPKIHLGDVDYDEYWDNKRGESLGGLSDWQRERADMVISFIKDENPKSIADVGCGDGSILKYIGDKVSNIDTKIGLDISENALKVAEKFGIKTQKLDLRDGAKLNIKEEVDYVFLFEILEHIQNSEDLLLDSCDKAKKGVFFSFPNTGFVVHRTRLLLGKFPLQWTLFPGEHLRYWTLRDLKWWLKELGFKNYKIKAYRGIPILNKIWPAMFAAGLFVYLKND